MSDIPPEVISNIFSRLPVKSLLRFRCVSKPMCALIDSPNFIKSHLHQSLKYNSHRSIILGGNDKLYSIDFDSFKRPILLKHVLESLKPKSHPYTMPEILGSCKGLLCLLNSEDDIFLCNPSTRRHHKLPVSKTQFAGLPGTENYPESFVFHTLSKITYGFGYNRVNDDYNVVRITQLYAYGRLCINEVMVYSLKSNSWRRIKDFPYYIFYKKGNCVFASGVFHWMASLVSTVFDPNDPKVIVSLDIRTEEYQLVPLPKHSDDNFNMLATELGGSLCVVFIYDSRSMDFWVMKNYGFKESWTKLFSIAQPDDIISHNLLPAAYSKSGDQVLLEQVGRKFIWYDLTSKTVKSIRIPGMPEFSEAFVCMGSLVKPCGSGKTEVTQKSEKKEVKKKKAQQKRDDFLSKGFKLAL